MWFTPVLLALLAQSPDAERSKQISELQAKAAHHEAEADRLHRMASRTAMAHKWPALAFGPANLEREKARKAREAAVKLAGPVTPKS